MFVFIFVSGRNKLKAALHYGLEDHTSLCLEMGLQTSRTGQSWSPAELDQAVDAITTQDVTGVAARVSKTRPAVAAVGRLHKMPHLEELV